MNKQAKQVAAPDKKKKALMIGFGVAALGAITYFGWQYWQKRKAQSEQTLPDPLPDVPVTPTKKKTSKPATSRNDSFPLKKGSKGENVKALQQALIDKYGKSILPKYGADGDFGSEMVAALKKAGLPEQVTESTFNVITSASALDPKKAAMDLYKAASSKDFAKAIDALKQLKNVNDYKAVSPHFLNYRIGGNVRQTIVTGLTNTFSKPEQKDQLRMEFLRMGLNYDGNKWSLSGIDSPAIITTIPTLVWKDKQTSIQVPASMVLGREISRKAGYVLFENSGQHFLVTASAIRPFLN